MEAHFSKAQLSRVKPIRNELLTLLLVFVAVFAVRLGFRQISFWDWDELLFASSLHNYDIMIDMPHPPGYFIWVVLMRVAYKIFGNEVNALVSLNVFFGSLTVFPLYFIFRQAASAKVAMAGVLIYLFNPSVWVEGETGFSDTTAVFWFILALAVLMRAQENRYLYLGCFLLGIALGVRTQNIFMDVFLLIPLWRKLRAREYAAVVRGVAILTITCLTWLLLMAVYGAGGIEVYFAILREKTRMVSVEEYSLVKYLVLPQVKAVLHDMLISIWGNLYLATAANLLALTGLIVYAVEKKWWELFLISVCFFPYFIFTFFILDLSYLKYTIPYIPFFCFFIAVAIQELADRLKRLATPAFAAGVALMILFCAITTVPAVKILHQNISPVIQAINYIQDHLSPQKDIIYYDSNYYSFVRHYLKRFNIEALSDFRKGEARPRPGMNAYVLSAFYPERGSTWSRNFSQMSPTLSILGQRHMGSFYNVWLNQTDIVYVNFIPRPERTSFWMRRKALCYLKNSGRDKELSLQVYVPTSLFKQMPTVSIYLNDRLLEEFKPEDEHTQKVFSIPGAGLEANTWSKLDIKTDRLFKATNADFAEEADGYLGLILEELAWTDAGETKGEGRGAKGEEQGTKSEERGAKSEE